MTRDEIRNDMLYHTAISVVKSMLEQELLTEGEYAKIDANLLRKYHPYLGILLSENA